MTCTGCKTSCAPYELKDGECHQCTHTSLTVARTLLDQAVQEKTVLEGRVADLRTRLADARQEPP